MRMRDRVECDAASATSTATAAAAAAAATTRTAIRTAYLAGDARADHDSRADQGNDASQCAEGACARKAAQALFCVITLPVAAVIWCVAVDEVFDFECL